MPRYSVSHGISVFVLLSVALAACSGPGEAEYSCRYESKVATAYDFDDRGSGDSFQSGDWQPYCVSVATEAECRERTESATNCFEGSCSTIRYQKVSFFEGTCDDRNVEVESAALDATAAVTDPGATSSSAPPPPVTEPLAPTTSLSQPPAPTITVSQTPSYEQVFDAAGAVSLNVPTHWADRMTEPLTVGDAGDISAIFAAPDLSRFLDSYEGPGVAVYYGASGLFAGADLEEWIALATAPSRADCVVDSENLTPEMGSGIFVSCGGAEANLAYFGALVNGGEARLFLLFQWLDHGDFRHFEEAFESVRFR